ncbi:5-hydroxytryptamine receptor 3A-like [Arapaima gigas]
MDFNMNGKTGPYSSLGKQAAVSLCVQRWRDEFLSWDPADYGGMKQVTLPASWVWTPNMVVHEAVSEGRQQSAPYVSLSFSGRVQLVELLLLDLRCDLLMFLFPFDKQTCNLTLGSNLHTAQEVVLVLEESIHSLLPTQTLHGEWELLSVRSHTFTQVQRHQSYSRITFQVHSLTVMSHGCRQGPSHLPPLWCPLQVELQRYSLFYVMNLMVPSTLVMIIDLAGFCIPVESAERIPFKVTLLFGYTVFLVLVTDLLPPFRDATPMLGLYLVVCLAFLSLSMGESVVLLALGQPELLEAPSRLYAIVSMLCPHVLQEPRQPTGQCESGVARGLQRSYGFCQQGTELSCGRDCVIEALAAELKEVSEELQTLMLRLHSRQRGLRLMEAMDRVCFRVYLGLFASFLTFLSLLWALYR